MKEKDSAEKNNKMGIVYPHVTTYDVFKEYWMSSKLYWPVLVLIALSIFVATIAGSVVAPTYYKKFFDILTDYSSGSTRDISVLVPIIFFILALNLTNWIGWRISWFATNYLEGHVMRDCLERSFNYLIGHSHSFFINNFAGSLVQRVNRFSRAFETIFERIFYDISTLVLKIIGAGIVLYMINPIIALAMGIWVFIFLIISYIFTRIKLKYDIRASAEMSKISGTLSDAISNHGSIQFFSGYKEESERVDQINTPFMKLNIFRWNFGSYIDAVQALLSVAIEFIIFYYGIKYWQLGAITLGTFVLVQTYIVVMGNSLWSFGRVVRDIYQGVADAKEMVEILHLEHEIQDMPNAKEMKVEKGAIEFKNVTFAFGQNKPVLDGINISIKPGEKVAFIGSSGAGKSTLVKLLLRLHDIQKGEILVDDQNIKNVTQKSLRESISLVPQDPALFHRTLMENIRYGRRNATDVEVRHAAKLAHCDEFINELPQKYETYVGERGVKLSGGERQRVAIARAILKNAPVLILDEATSSLDSHSESLIQDALHTLMEGKTTIVIAHRLSTIRKMDRIIVVSKGGVVEEGSHDELIQKPGGIYAKLWSLQAGGFTDKSIEELLES